MSTPPSNQVSNIPPNKDETKKDTASTTKFLSHIYYPGKKKTKLERSLRKQAISTFQQNQSLHSMYAHAFQTQSIHSATDNSRSSKRNNSNNNKGSSSTALQTTTNVEPFQPACVLEFLSHFGVKTSAVHEGIIKVLRSKLQEQIDQVSDTEALIKLSENCWASRNVPELRPVLISVIKKLGNKTPVLLLERLADKEDDSDKLKHQELLEKFGLPLWRLVYEADWERKAKANIISEENNAEKPNSDNNTSILSDIINKHMIDYCSDEELVRMANLPFTWTISDRRIPTQQRRLPNAHQSSKTSTMTTKSKSLLPTSVTRQKDTGASSSEKTIFSKSSENVQKIKEIIGDRPKLLSAVLHMLIDKHGTLLEEKKEKILGGASFLPCTLLSDVLLSYGILPKEYSYVGILATVLDDAVKTGVLSDDAVAQVQGCLREIFSSVSSTDTTTKENSNSTGGPATSTQTTTQPVEKPTPNKKQDAQIPAALLRKVISSAISAMKKTDSKLVFLNPVTDAIAPGYSSVISKPMCILKVEQKNNAQKYKSIMEFEKDVDLMFQNCINYNVGSDGTWFRGEAKRQKKIFRTDILSQAKKILKKESAKLKSQQNTAAANNNKRKRASDVNEKNNKKSKTIIGFSSSATSTENVAIKHLKSADISPLAAIKFKKKKNALELLETPSAPALAGMILSDPFVMRLFLERILRVIRVEVMKEKSLFLPVTHNILPSLLQIVHIAQWSCQWCAIRGRKFLIPESGVIEEQKSNTEQSKSTFMMKISKIALRKHSPLIANLILTLQLDQRLSIGGDLHQLTLSGRKIQPLPLSSGKEWDTDGVNLVVIRALMQYVLVYLISQKQEASLATQLPRLQTALEKLSPEIAHDRPFWMSLVSAILYWKRKISPSTRDLLVDFWMHWFTSPPFSSSDNDEEEQKESILYSSIHEIFMYLLNEWAALGNQIIPRDKLLSISQALVEKVDNACQNQSKKKENESFFSKAWSEDKFSYIRKEYERMLLNVGEEHAKSWKERVGITD